MSAGNMNISNLSYKELQALALRYRVPGNIKKQLLIEVLQAARCGNEQEVDKLLADLRQNRKKRVRKGKPTKLTMNLASTPIHSPNYDMADEYYAVQHRLPYQWVGAEEEIPNRQLDEANRVPNYEEFRQYLFRRIQRNYPTCNTNNNEKVESVDPGGIMDLRSDQEETIRFETNTAVGVRTNNIVPVSGIEIVKSYSEQIAQNPAAFDYQILEDSNGNGNASILLRRMLQAPVGADLGEIASPELGSNCRIWGTDQYQSQNNLLDNSDTLSANSDINGNDDNNWPTGTDYYRFVNNARDQSIFNLNASNIPGSKPNFDQPAAIVGEFCNVLTDGFQTHQYPLLSDIQQPHGQQQWETAGPFSNDVLNYQKPKSQGSKIFSAETNYYDGINAANYVTPRIVESDPLQQQYVNEDGSTAGYSANQNGFEGNNSPGSALSRSEMKFYQNLNNNRTDRSDIPIANVYSSLENSARQINELNNYTLVRPTIHSTNYYTSGEAMQQTPGFITPMHHPPFCNFQQQAPPPAHTGYVENLGCISQPPELVEEFNRPSILEQYHMIHKSNSIAEENQQLYQHEERNVIKRVEAERETEAPDQNKTSLGSTPASQSDSTMSIEPFWPQKSVVKNTADNFLENIMNLNTFGYGYVDYAKIDQTSCIYCYSAPIVTQRLFTGNSPCSQKKRFTAEFRQHTFSPYWLLYNDTNTGMQMSKHVRAVNQVKESVVERQSDEIIEAPVGGIADIAVDLGNTDGNVQMEDINELRPLSVDSTLRLDEQQLNSIATQPIIDTDQCHGKEISSFDSNGQLHIKSGDTSCADNYNDQAETAESSINLNMENIGQNDPLQDENYDASRIIELSENPSTNV